MEFQWGHLPEVDGRESGIALLWPAGAGADGAATSVNITSRRLNIPTVTFAPDRITLKSKLIFFFSHFR